MGLVLGSQPGQQPMSGKNPQQTQPQGKNPQQGFQQQTPQQLQQAQQGGKNSGQINTPGHAAMGQLMQHLNTATSNQMGSQGSQMSALQGLFGQPTHQATPVNPAQAHQPQSGGKNPG
jgi:hypothetical protein